MSTITKSIVALIAVLGIVAVSVVSQTAFTAFGAAPSGLPAVVGTSTTMHLVAATPTLVFPTSTYPQNCAARVITTASSSVQISFSDKQSLVPGATAGHIQGASTTVAYDSGIYGCDAVRIYSWTAQKITIQESR